MIMIILTNMRNNVLPVILQMLQLRLNMFMIFVSISFFPEKSSQRFTLFNLDKNYTSSEKSLLKRKVRFNILFQYI